MSRVFSTPFILFILAGSWFIGFLTFVDNIERLKEPTIDSALSKTDAIVVLTGGSERLPAGVQLLMAGTAKKLFISGVHKKLTLDALLSSSPLPEDLRDCCVTLGYEAGTTVGNAEESHEWMTLQEYHSLRLVTANYHMPRSLLLFHDAMPDVEIIPYPITPDTVILRDWWQHPGTAELLATEYSKYLMADFRLWVSQQ